MNQNYPNILTKVHYQDNEILTIPTQSDYQELRRMLFNNEKCSIPKKLPLFYMNDLGDLLELNQENYSDFLESTDGICYHIESKDGSILKNPRIIPHQQWICCHCQSKNEAELKLCKRCGEIKRLSNNLL